ncbi:MAG: phenylacetate-CoA oxygenase subunit PaaC [Chitinophagaceae bacterium]|nr:phenylacetate-CoA oxygenase subunit PaaC [Chitinophagaceae bacterium]
MNESNTIDYLMLLADSSLIMGQRLSEWTGHGPMLEQDIAITNISLDTIGQARYFYQLAAARLNEKSGNADVTEDTLAYLRDAHQYKNLLLVELPNGDWGQTILKIFFYAHRQKLMYEKLSGSADAEIAGIASKALKEVEYHVSWSSDWVKRLGDGTQESHDRMTKALEYLWPYTGEMFVPATYEKNFLENEFSFDVLKQGWLDKVSGILTEATLSLPPADTYMHTGGKTGVHTEYLGYILAEMQFLQRAYPGCEW